MFIYNTLNLSRRVSDCAGSGIRNTAATAILTLLVCSCVKQNTPVEPKEDEIGRATEAGGNAAPGIDTSTPNTASTGSKEPAAPAESCESYLKKITPIYQSIPEDLRALKPAQADQLAANIEKAIVDCEKYLSNCAYGPISTKLRFYQSKFLQLISSRIRTQVINDMSKDGAKFTTEDLDRKMAPFYNRVIGHASMAVDGLKNSSELKPSAIEICAWAHTNLKEPRKARDDYLNYLKTYPNNPRITVLTAALGRVLSDLEEYDTGVKLVEEKMATAQAQKSPDFPTLGETRWKLYEAKGDIAGLLRSAESVLQDYPERTRSSQYSFKTREAYSRYLAFNGFRKGYSLMALGRMDEARDAFDSHVTEINKLQAALEKRGHALKPAINIYRQRSENALGFIKKIALLPAPADFELGEMWVTQKRTRLKESTGKVVGLIFRGAEDTRSATFLANIGEFSEANDDMEMVAVHFFKSAKNIDEQLESLRQELAGTGYAGAAGFDPDLTGRKLFRSWGVFVGSATFLIIDKQGRPVWFQQDPRTRDTNLVKSILLRVVESE